MSLIISFFMLFNSKRIVETIYELDSDGDDIALYLNKHQCHRYNFKWYSVSSVWAIDIKTATVDIFFICRSRSLSVKWRCSIFSGILSWSHHRWTVGQDIQMLLNICIKDTLKCQTGVFTYVQSLPHARSGCSAKRCRRKTVFGMDTSTQVSHRIYIQITAKM